MDPAPVKHNPLWLIALANVTLNGFGFIAAVPFLLRRAGVPVPQITNHHVGIAADYHVGARTTALLGAGGGTAANAAGAVVGGRVAGRIGARRNYPLAGILAGICGAGILLAPVAPATFTIGSLVYASAAGFCGAAARALIIELTGGSGQAASTWFATLYAASDLPWAYMQWADGQGYKHFGPRGLRTLFSPRSR